jgi:hypothetical protein
MGKRNKIRYQSEKKPKIIIVLTGQVMLRYVDEEAIELAKKGDLMVFPSNDALNSTRMGDYESTGFSGYFKVDVHDGKRWQPVIISDIFSNHENHFAKSERPIDTYSICLDMLQQLSGKRLMRTYREHYTPDDDEPDASEG